MTPRLLLIPALFCFLLLPGAAGPAFPGPESPGASARPKTRPATMQRGPAAPAGAFAERDRERIRRYFRREAPGLPPGLARRGGDLPPGLEKQLRVGGHLPPGSKRRCRDSRRSSSVACPPRAPACAAACSAAGPSFSTGKHP